MTSGSNSGGKSGRNNKMVGCPTATVTTTGSSKSSQLSKQFNSRSTTKTIEKSEVEVLRQKVVELVTDDPRKASLILSEWLKKAEAPRKKKAA